MARVVIVGGGFAGMAVAARLGKLGHQVAVVEAGPELGGALVPVRAEGFAWDGGPSHLTMPAALRDLFRKSGRSIEAELGRRAGSEDDVDLEPLPVVREHRFEDGTSIALPAGSRAGQQAALDDVEPGLGAAWSEWVDPFGEVWDVVRQHYAERPWDRGSAPRDLNRLLDTRETLHRRLRKEFRDDRLAFLAGHPFTAAGHDLRNVPIWAGLVAYLEQRFGVWRVPGGMTVLRDLLVERLEQRSVVVLREAPVRDVIVRGGRAVGVRTDQGDVEADLVVVAIDPRRLPALAPHVVRTMPAIPPVVAHLGLDGADEWLVPDLPHEVVLDGDPMVVVRPMTAPDAAPPGGTAWTVHGRGRLEEDLLRTMARRGIDVRDRVVTRVDLNPRQLVEQWHGSPLGVAWQGRGTVRQRLGPTTPVEGVYACGAHANPAVGAAGLPFAALSAAQVAESIGSA